MSNEFNASMDWSNNPNEFDASEARKKALEINNSIVDKQYSKVKSIIKAAAEQGQYSVYASFSLRTEVRERLTNEGFTVAKTESFRDESSTKISW